MVMHFNACLLSLLMFLMVLMTWMLAQMKVYFPLLYAEWRIWTYENAIECKQKCKNRYWIWVTCKCLLLDAHECIFTLSVGQFTQMNAYFLVMNSKRCILNSNFTSPDCKPSFVHHATSWGDDEMTKIALGLHAEVQEYSSTSASHLQESQTYHSSSPFEFLSPIMTYYANSACMTAKNKNCLLRNKHEFWIS